MAERPPVIWLCEGEPDCICARSRGLRAVCATSGAGTWKDAWTERLAGADVVICYDADLAGYLGALRVAGKIAPAAARVRVLLWPDAMLRPDGPEIAATARESGADGPIGGDGGWPARDDERAAQRRGRAMEASPDERGAGYARVLPPDHGQDLTDFFMTHGRTTEDLERLLGRALLIEAPAPAPPAAEAEPGQSRRGRKGPWRFFEFNDDNRPRFVPSWLARHLVDEMDLITDRETMLHYRWTGTHYARAIVEDLQRRAIELLEKQASMTRVSDAVRQAIAMSLLPDGEGMNPRPELLCLPTGMLDLDTLELLPHDRGHRATVLLPWAVDPGRPENCPRFKEFLAQSIGDALVIREVQEFFGYCLWRSCQFEKALFCIGVEGSGKGTLLHILREMLGQENCASVDLEEMEKSFVRSALHDKAANVFFECDAKRFTTKYFNAIASGDPMEAQFKYGDSFTMQPWAKMAFSANEIPRPFHASEAYLDRVLPVHYATKVRGTDRQDPYLREKLLAEMPGIFAWAVVGLVRLRARGRFRSSPRTAAFLDQYRLEANPVASFADDCLETVADDYEYNDWVYGAYRRWCKDGERKPWDKGVFWSRLRAVTGARNERRSIDGERKMVAVGIRLREGVPHEA